MSDGGKGVTAGGINGICNRGGSVDSDGFANEGSLDGGGGGLGFGARIPCGGGDFPGGVASVRSGDGGAVQGVGVKGLGAIIAGGELETGKSICGATGASEFTRLVIGPSAGEGGTVRLVDFFGLNPATGLFFPGAFGVGNNVPCGGRSGALFEGAALEAEARGSFGFDQCFLREGLKGTSNYAPFFENESAWGGLGLFAAGDDALEGGIGA